MSLTKVTYSMIDGAVANVLDFGADPTGVADSAAAFTSALAASRSVVVPAGTYRLTSTVTLNQFGQNLIGIGGKNTTVLSIDQTTGPGVTLAQGQCVLQNLTITASNARQSYTTGATYDLAADLFGVKIYNAGGFLTQCLIDRVVVQRHPNHGIYMGGEGADTMFIQCESYYNRGHGYAFDDRTIGGGTSGRCGIVTIESCRALDNGGNAVNLSQIGSTCYRFIVNNLETIWNAWNPSVPSYQNCEFYLSGENNVIQQSAFGDPNGDTRTVMGNGDPRLAKATLSTGITIRSSADNLVLTANRFISTDGGVVSGGGVRFLKVVGAYFTQQQLSTGSVDQPFGFSFPSTTPYLFLDVQVPSSTSVTNMLDANTAGGTLRVDDEEFYVYGEQGSSLTGDHLNLTSFGTSTVAATVANIQNKYVNLSASGATNLVALYFAGALNLLPPAMTFYVKNVSAHTITLKNGASAGYIRTKSGGDVTVASGQTFVVFTDDAGNPYEV